MEIKDNKLFINASDSTMLSLLEKGAREIERALSWQGLELNVEIVEKKKEKSNEEQDLEKLKRLFSMKLKIKE